MAASSPNPWKRSPSTESPTPSPLHQITEKLRETSLTNGSGGSSREQMRMSMVGRKKNFKHVERVNGRLVNITEGLELHTGVFNADEQRKIVDCVYQFQEKGRNRQLRGSSFEEPVP